MSWNLFLDDERHPKQIYSNWLDYNFVIAKDYKEACCLVENKGLPAFVSFDHDLGIGKTGYDFAKWVIEKDLDGEIEVPLSFSYHVHSKNPVGAKNIRELLSSFLKSKLT